MITFNTHNNNNMDTDGTSYINAIYDVPYRELVEVFGEPMKSEDDGKTRAEWHIEFMTKEARSAIATIYDWKTKTPIEELTHWHVGGFQQRAVELVKQALREAKESNVKVVLEVYLEDEDLWMNLRVGETLIPLGAHVTDQINHIKVEVAEVDGVGVQLTDQAREFTKRLRCEKGEG